MAYYISDNDLEENYIRDYTEESHLPHYMIPLLISLKWSHFSANR